MQITRLEINRLRNLKEVKVNPGAHFNLIYGDNGSGKSSFLEAIHYVGLGRSFRTHLHNRLIQHEQDSFSLFGMVQAENLTTPVGIQRTREGNTQIHIREQPTTGLVELAKLLPLQLINADAHRLLLSTPKYRRQFLDWGLFHVEPTFITHWQRAMRALKQRNAALRAHAPFHEVSLWDTELVLSAEALDKLRQYYIESLQPIFSEMLKILLENMPISLHYQRGWPLQQDLLRVLTDSLPRDLEVGYSQFGPQRADLSLRLHQMPAQEVLSQGQQKLLVYALRLAQSLLLQQQTGRNNIYLIDDLPAELDTHKRHQVASILQTLNTQVFVTGIEKKDLSALFPASQSTLFHVEQGVFNVL